MTVNSKELKKNFAMFDKDCSGTVTPDEMKAILTRPVGGQPAKFTEEQAAAMVDKFDANGDGVLSINEFVAAWSDIGGSTQEGDSARIKELEARVKELEAENAKLRKGQRSQEADGDDGGEEENLQATPMKYWPEVMGQTVAPPDDGWEAEGTTKQPEHISFLQGAMATGSIILKSLPTSTRDALAQSCKEKTVDAGVKVATQGEPCDSCHFLFEGECDIDYAGTPSGKVSKGAVLGELSLLQEERASFTVTTTGPCKFLTLDETTYKSIVLLTARKDNSVAIADGGGIGGGGSLLFSSLSPDDFKLLDTLGGGNCVLGGMTRVRLAKYDNRPAGAPMYYALKMMKKSEVIYLKQVEQVKREKAILTTIGQLGHPFVVLLYGGFQDDKLLYLMFEYVIGGIMFSHLRKAGRFPSGTSKFYAAQATLALDYLQTLRVVYRGLQTHNMALDRIGHLKLFDFGFSKRVGREEKTFTLCGVPEYLAPEMILGTGHSMEVDWWALGVFTYEMLAGYTPFQGEAPISVYQKVLTGDIKFPWHFDESSKDLIRKLLTPDPAKRLGCSKAVVDGMYQDGAKAVKQHKWFAIDTSEQFWADIERKNFPPPIKPDIAGEFDTGNYERYPDSVDGPSPIDPNDQEFFSDF